MTYFLQFRPLLIIYGICVIPATIEYMHGQDGISVQNNISANPENVQALAQVFGELYPNRSTVYYYKGYHALRARNYQTALESFERAVELDPTHEGSVHGYAETLACMQAPTHLIAQASERWRKDFPHSNRTDPQELVVQDSRAYELGIQAVREMRLADARQYFEQDLRAGVRTEQLLYNYALVLTAMQAPDEEVRAAIDAWKKTFPFSSMPDPRSVLNQ